MHRRAVQVLVVIGLLSLLLSTTFTYASRLGSDSDESVSVTTKPDRIDDGKLETQRVTISVGTPAGTSTPQGTGTTAAGGTCWVDFIFLHEDYNARLYTEKGVQCIGSVDPQKVVITFYDSNVNNARRVYARSDSTWYCHWLNDQCGGSKTVYSHRVRRTSYVTAKLELYASGGFHDATLLSLAEFPR